MSVSVSDENKNNAARLFWRDARSKTFYQETYTTLDVMTGEIVGQVGMSREFHKNPEPPFIKVYYECMLATAGIQGVPADLLIGLAKFAPYVNDDSEPMIIRIDKPVKDYLCRLLGKSEAMIKKYIRQCVDAGILIRSGHYRGYYEVNPWIVARGDFSKIKKLQLQYDFINGTWKRVVEYSEEEAANE